MANINSVIIGVDTHKSIHVAVAIDENGSRLAAFSAPATSKGYLALEGWACALGAVKAFGIEGTGSYGAGLSRHLLAQGHKVIEVTRPNRQLRYPTWQERFPRCRRRSTVRVGWAGHCRAENADRLSRDDPPPKNRARYRGQMPVTGYGDTENPDHQRACVTPRHT